jgi:hypothetical protein
MTLIGGYPRRVSAARSLLIGLLAVLALAGCGGGGALDAEVPASYVTFRGEGVTFAHPPGWQPERQPFPEGGAQIIFAPPSPGPEPSARISLSVERGVTPEDFESLIDQVRSGLVERRSGEIVSDEEVDVAGAQVAFRLVIEFPPGPGTDPVAVRSTIVDLLTDGGTSVSLAVPVAQRGGEEPVDAEAVLASLRVVE